jgi:hypothetical protein
METALQAQAIKQSKIYSSRMATKSMWRLRRWEAVPSFERMKQLRDVCVRREH